MPGLRNIRTGGGRARLGRALCPPAGRVVRRPKKRLRKADEAKREAFVREYRPLRVLAQFTGAKIFFADEAHFYADAEAFIRHAASRAAGPMRRQREAVQMTWAGGAPRALCWMA